MQAGGRRFDPVILHHSLSGKPCRLDVKRQGLLLNEATELLFNNMEEGCIASADKSNLRYGSSDCIGCCITASTTTTQTNESS